MFVYLINYRENNFLDDNRLNVFNAHLFKKSTGMGNRMVNAVCFIIVVLISDSFAVLNKFSPLNIFMTEGNMTASVFA